MEFLEMKQIKFSKPVILGFMLRECKPETEALGTQKLSQRFKKFLSAGRL